jgi:hypothetical protein
MGVMEAVGCRGASVGTVFVPHPTRKLIERTRQNININRFADSLAGCCLLFECSWSNILLLLGGSTLIVVIQSYRIYIELKNSRVDDVL